MKLVNKKAKFDYFLTDSLEVGIVLKGSEVKAVLKGNLSLKESYVKIIDNEVWLINASISEMVASNFEEINPLRPKKLLLHKKQIKKFQKLLTDPGTTLLMYSVYTDDNGKLKGNLNLGKGKKSYDKRNVIRERDISRRGE